MAVKQKSSVAELIRQSVDNLIRETSEVDMAERRQRAIAAAGRFHSGRTDISTHHDDYLTEAYQTWRIVIRCEREVSSHRLKKRSTDDDNT